MDLFSVLMGSFDQSGGCFCGMNAKKVAFYSSIVPQGAENDQAGFNFWERFSEFLQLTIIQRTDNTFFGEDIAPNDVADVIDQLRVRSIILQFNV